MGKLGDYIGSIKILLRDEETVIENLVFYLHRRTTFLLLLFAFTWSLFIQIEFPMDCVLAQKSSVPAALFNTYCLIHSTYVVIDKLNSTAKVGVDMPYPGVMPLVSRTDEVRYHRYYVWTFASIFIQALLFHLPFLLWNYWEGGMAKEICSKVRTSVSENAEKQKRLIVRYLKDSFRLHNRYAVKFILCELLNCLNVICQILTLDHMFENGFSQYGFSFWRVLTMDYMDRRDKLVSIFPLVTKCTYSQFGPGGNIIPHSGICVLPANAFHEKIYFVIWVWLYLMSILSSAMVIYRLATLYIPQYRYFLLKWMAPHSTDSKVRTVIRRGDYGDWFLLMTIASNVDSLVLGEIIDKLANKIVNPILDAKDSDDEENDKNKDCIVCGKCSKCGRKGNNNGGAGGGDETGGSGGGAAGDEQFDTSATPASLRKLKPRSFRSCFAKPAEMFDAGIEDV